MKDLLKALVVFLFVLGVKAPQRSCRAELISTLKDPLGVWEVRGQDLVDGKETGSPRWLRVSKPRSRKSAFQACDRWIDYHRTGFEIKASKKKSKENVK